MASSTAFDRSSSEGYTRLFNGDFEEPAGEEIPGWELVLEEGATGYVQIDPTHARSGSQSVRLVRTNALGRMYLRSREPVKLAGDEHAVFRGYFRAEEAPMNSALLFRFETEQGHLSYGNHHNGHALTSQTLLRNTAAGAWDKRLAEYAPNGKPRELRVRIYLQGNPVAVWLDDLAFPAKPYRFTHSAPVMTLPRFSPEEAQQQLASRTNAIGQIVRRKGQTQILINEEPVAPAFYLPAASRSDFADYAYMEGYGGIQLQHVSVPINDLVSYIYPINYPVWTRTDRYDFTSIFQTLNKLAATAPNAYAILNFNIIWPEDWVDRNPTEAWLNSQGQRGHGPTGHFRGFSDQLPAGHRWWPSPYSEKALEDAADVMRAFIRELRSTPYYNIVVGCFISGGHDGQFFTGRWPDHSEPGVRAWQRWLEDRYGSIEALRAAWHESVPSFAAIGIPGEIEAPDHPLSVSFLDPTRDRSRVDYAKFISERGMVIRDYFAGVFKEAIGKSTFALTWQMAGGRAAGARSVFMESKFLDAIAPQTSYELRHPGYIGGITAMHDSFNLHGKLVIKELDLRTWRRSGGGEIATQRLGAALNPQWFESINRKEVGQMLARNQGYWYYDIGSTHYRDRGMVDEIHRTRSVVQSLIDEEPAEDFQPGVALVTLEDSSYWGWPRHSGRAGWLAMSNYTSVMLKTSGVPYREYHLEDVMANPQLHHYRVYILDDAWRLTQEQRQFIQEKLQRDGRTIIWMYAPGFISDAGLSTQSMGELIGMPVATEGRLNRTAAWAVESADPLSRKLPALQGMGEMYRTMYTISNSPNRTFDVQRFWIDEEAAEDLSVLARYADGKAAIGVRRFADWTSVYVAAPGGLEAQLLNNIATAAGAYVVSQPGAALEMNGRFISLHGTRGGDYALKLPGLRDVIDPFSGEVLARRTETFQASVEAQQTLWLLLTPPQ